MEKPISLTNENLSKKFKSNFELVNYAIKLAENMIETGRDARVKSEVQNRAMLILEEIKEGKDRFDEVKTDAEPSSKGERFYAESEIKQEFIVDEELVIDRRRNRAVGDEYEG